MNVIEDFLKLCKTNNTRDTYKQAINKYFNCIKADPNNYFNNKRDYQQDIKKYVELLKKLSPKTQRAYSSIIKRFFLINDIEFKTKFWDIHVKSQLEKSYAITLDDKPSIAQLKTILNYADLKGKTIFTILASSGMRVSELLQITLENVDLKSNPVMITLESSMTKNRRPRRVFISDEAKKLLVEWLNGGRQRSIEFSNKRMKAIYTIDANDKRIFPNDDCAIRRIWGRLLRKSGLDKKCLETDRFELHVNSLRKFFISEMKTVIPDVIVGAFVGHSKYLSDAYERYSLDEMKQYYLNGMSKLMIFETQPDLTDMNKKMDEKDKQIQELLEFKKIMELKMQGLETRLEVEKLKNK